MECKDARRLVHAYVDGELDLTESLEIERHLTGCPDCRREQSVLLALREGLAAGAPYFRAPAGLAGRMQAALSGGRMLAGESGALAPSVTSGANAVAPPAGRTKPGASRMPDSSWSSRWSRVRDAFRSPRGYLLGAAAALALIAVIAWGAVQWQARSQQEYLVAQEVTSSSLRALMAGPLTGVPSSDRHTVKPWFAGKLDFSPIVQDFAAQGFPLVGGRVDYVNSRAVAALVYRHQGHVINLYTWPAEGAPDAPPTGQAIQGYNLLRWTQGGAVYWAVSDMDAGELRQFAGLVRGSP